MKKAIYSETLDVDTRLEELGLSIDVLHAALECGQAFRDECTLNDPPAFPGMIAWARTIRSLRENLIPLGWVRSNEQKIPVVINPSGKVAIAVATGNTDTGNAGNPSKTKYPKGPATIAAVEKNAIQLTFDYYEENARKQPQRKSDCMTWVLLISKCGDELRSELSLPSEIDDDGRVAAWSERILLPPIPIDNAPQPIIFGEEGADDIVVEISRRFTQP